MAGSDRMVGGRRATWVPAFAAAIVAVAVAVAGAAGAGREAVAPVRSPVAGATDVNPDTPLVLTFATPPTPGRRGRIRIIDAATRAVVDTLDLAIPDGPLRREAGSASPGARYQRMVIGGFTEGFHFHPIIIHGRTATIYPHEHAFTYGRTYRVEIDPGVLVAGGFDGVTAADGWTFQTRAVPPDRGATRFVVAADGSGDFATVQGAVDFVPDDPARRVTIFIRDGTYEEIVYFRHKHDLTFLGEDRNRVVIEYANNEIFNGPPPGVRTNERPGTFPYRRAAFMADRSSGIHLVNLTVVNVTPPGGGQAEALLLSGGRNIVSHVTLRSHQDTVQLNDPVYLEKSRIDGDTDFLWGRGPAYFRDCDLTEQSGGPFMWVRSTAATHGFVFVNCRFRTTGAPASRPFLARNTAAYPHSEVALIECALGDIDPAAWSLAGDTSAMRYREFHSTRLSDGAPADVSRRHPASRQLTMAADRDTVETYRNAAAVLGGWTPVMAPIVLDGPADATVRAGRAGTFRVEVAAVPAPSFRWRLNGRALGDGPTIRGAATDTLMLRDVTAASAGVYSVTVANAGGTATSDGATLHVER